MVEQCCNNSDESHIFFIGHIFSSRLDLQEHRSIILIEASFSAVHQGGYIHT